MVDKVHFPDLVQLNDVYFCEYNLLPRGNSLINLNLIINNKKIADANRLKQLLNMPTVDIYALPVCYSLDVYIQINMKLRAIKTNRIATVGMYVDWMQKKIFFPDPRPISNLIVHLQSTNFNSNIKAPIDLDEEIHVSKIFTRKILEIY